MDLREKLENALKEAMRSNKEIEKRTIRMVLSAVKFSDIEKGTKLDENGIIAVLHKEIKSRKEAAAEAEKANRSDLFENNQSEIKVLESFLPVGMSQEELNQLVQQVIAEVGASSPADMGKVMKKIIPMVQGRASGDQISQTVKSALQK